MQGKVKERKGKERKDTRTHGAALHAMLRAIMLHRVFIIDEGKKPSKVGDSVDGH